MSQKSSDVLFSTFLIKNWIFLLAIALCLLVIVMAGKLNDYNKLADDYNDMVYKYNSLQSKCGYAETSYNKLSFGNLTLYGMGKQDGR